MSNGIEKYQPEISDIDQWAKKLYESGSFTDAKSVAQAFVKIAAGAELGLTPFQSMSGVHLIQGKPVVGAGLLAALLDRDPAYGYSVEWEPDEKNPDACTIIVTKDGKLRGKSRFSLEDAKRAGLTGGNWQKYPSAMLFARAMSQAVRWYAPGATGTSVYVEGELTADVEVDIPEGVTAKPRTRVTAEVIREGIETGTAMGYQVEDGGTFDPATEPPPSVVLLPLRAQLTHMSASEKGDLWKFAGLERNTKMADVKSRLIAYADELDVAFTEEPDARAILDAARAAQKGSAEAFQHMLDTDEDLDPGDQASLEALA